MNAKIIRVDGKEAEAKPSKGKHFSLEELQAVVGGTIDIQHLPKDGKVMVVNDNGLLEGLKENHIASIMWRRNYPLDEYPLNNSQRIVGDVLVCDEGMIK